MPVVSVIIPVHGRFDLTRACLEALANQPDAADIEVVVVDNASPDETPRECPVLGESLFGARFRYERQERNINFGPACNRGAELASAPLLFFLNNDTIPFAGWLAPLADAFASEPSLGAAGPLLLYPSGQVQHLGVVFYVGLGAAHLYHKISGASPLARRRREFQALTGAALMLPAALFKSLDGFFPGFVNGCEDLDLCARLRGRGLRLLSVPESVIEHVASQSPGRFKREVENADLFRSRCASLVTPDFHAWCRREDMEMRVTPSGQIYMARPLSLSRQFMARFRQEADPIRILEFLEEEPLWEEGYEAMAVFLENEGMFEDALGLRLLQHGFFPRLEYCQRLRALGRKWGNEKVVEGAANGMTWHLDMMRGGEARRLLLEQQAYFRQEGEPGLAALCEKALSLQKPWTTVGAARLTVEGGPAASAEDAPSR